VGPVLRLDESASLSIGQIRERFGFTLDLRLEFGSKGSALRPSGNGTSTFGLVNMSRGVMLATRSDVSLVIACQKDRGGAARPAR